MTGDTCRDRCSWTEECVPRGVRICCCKVGGHGSYICSVMGTVLLVMGLCYYVAWDKNVTDDEEDQAVRYDVYGISCLVVGGVLVVMSALVCILSNADKDCGCRRSDTVPNTSPTTATSIHLSRMQNVRHNRPPTNQGLHIQTEGQRTPPHNSITSDPPPQYSEAINSPPQYSEAISSPPQYSEVDDSLPQYSEAINSPPQYSEAINSPPQYSEVDDSPPQYSEAIETQDLTFPVSHAGSSSSPL